jgi:hypothetical protein
MAPHSGFSTAAHSDMTAPAAETVVPEDLN